MDTVGPPGSDRSVDPDTWLDRHGDVLFRCAMMRVNDREAAEDLVQETLLAALAAASSYAGQASERTWLIGILKHKAIDHIRKAGRETPLGDVSEDEGCEEAFFTRRGFWRGGPGRWGRDPSQAFERKEFWDVLNDCIAQLPAQMASVFRLREIDELSTTEISGASGLSAGNVWTTLHRARTRLRGCLEANWFRSQAG